MLSKEKITASLFGLKKAYTLVTFLSVFQRGTNKRPRYIGTRTRYTKR